VEYLDGAGVKLARCFCWNWSQIGLNICVELEWKELLYLDGAGVQWAGIF
jgi:hypothetical protein